MTKCIRVFAALLLTLVCNQVFAVADEKLDYFGFLVTGKSTQGTVRDKLTAFAKERSSAGKLGFAAVFGEQSNNKAPRVAVMIFRGEDVDAVTKSLAELDSVKEKSLRVQVFPQYLVKDAMPRE